MNSARKNASKTYPLPKTTEPIFRNERNRRVRVTGKTTVAPAMTLTPAISALLGVTKLAALTRPAALGRPASAAAITRTSNGFTPNKFKKNAIMRWVGNPSRAWAAKTGSRRFFGKEKDCCEYRESFQEPDSGIGSVAGFKCVCLEQIQQRVVAVVRPCKHWWNATEGK